MIFGLTDTRLRQKSPWVLEDLLHHFRPLPALVMMKEFPYLWNIQMFSCGGFLAALATVESGFHGCINRWSCRNCGWSLMQSPRATTVSRKRRGMPHNASRSDAKKHERPPPCLSRSFSNHSKRDLLNRQTTVKGEYCRVIVLVATD